MANSRPIRDRDLLRVFEELSDENSEEDESDYNSSSDTDFEIDENDLENLESSDFDDSDSDTSDRSIQSSPTVNVQRPPNQNVQTARNDWGIISNRPRRFKFHPPPPVTSTPKANDPASFLELFISDELIENMVEATNKNAEFVLRTQFISRRSRYVNWKPVDSEMMKKFLGILLYSGIVSYPKIPHYWSSSVLYNNELIRKTMNIFQLILRLWHFQKDPTAESIDRLKKIRPLLRKLNMSFRKYRKMNAECVIDESMVPFRGRLCFRQYIPGKSHKYGVKLFKLCDPKGYTYSIEVYAGKNNDTTTTTEDLVMKLMTPFLSRRRLLVVDNFYTSVSLAERLLQSKTYILGTVRVNRKNLPKMNNNSLARGEMTAFENSQKVVFMAWQDRRTVRMLSTKLKLSMKTDRNKYGVAVTKPSFVLKYYETKQGIALSDQLSSYQTAVRKTIRWYHKVAEELLFRTTLVNAQILYNSYNARVPNFVPLSILGFREAVIRAWLNIEDVVSPIKLVQNPQTHFLQKLLD